MLRKKVTLVLLVSGLSILFSGSSALSQDSFIPWNPRVRFSLGSSRQGTSFYTDSLAPLGSDEESLSFLSLKALVNSGGAYEQSLGLGYRRLLRDQWIVGANLFYDSRYSENGFHHQQLGCGIEALSQWIDFRANYYHPTSCEKHIADDDYYAFGEKSLLKYETYEEALEGFDAEIGFLVPKISDVVETRLYAGGYWYNSKLGESIEGIKAGVRIRPSPALAFDVGLRNSDALGILVKGHLTIFFGDAKGRPQVAGSTSQLRERMSELVERDADILTRENTTQVKLHDMIYVDNSNVGDPYEDGSLSYPHSTLDAAFVNSLYGEGIWIYVREGDGTAEGYTGQYTLADGVTLWGEGYEYLGLGGGGYPIIDGDGDYAAIILANNNTVMGCQVQNGVAGILGQDVSGANIHHNVITGIIIGEFYGGIAFINNDSGTISNITISDNICLDHFGDNIVFINNDSGTISNIIILNNTCLDADGGIMFYNNSTGTISGVSVLSNTASRNFSSGIAFINSDSGTISNITISNNTSSGNLHGIGIGNALFSSGTISNITISNNTLSDNHYDGIGLANDQSTGTISGVTILNNTLSDNYNGIAISNDEAAGTISNITIAGNTIINNDCGIQLVNYTGGTLDVDIGGGSSDSEGYNSIYGNETAAIAHNLETIVMAENNWWGTTEPDSTLFIGDVDYIPYLDFDPNNEECFYSSKEGQILTFKFLILGKVATRLGSCFYAYPERCGYQF